MKLSVSLTVQDVATLDEYAHTAGLRSRSAALQQAIRLLRLAELETDYAEAWDEWAGSGDRSAWEVTSADGLGDAAR